MKLDTSQLTAVLEPLKKIAKHHPIIVFLVAFSVMIYTVFMVNTILNQPADEDYRLEQQQTKAKTNFDEATIEKIERLRARQETNPLQLPPGRINPFSE